MRSREIRLAAQLALAASAPCLAQEPAAPGPQALQAQITAIEGHALVFYAEQPEQGVPAEVGLPLDPGDRVQSEERSRVEISLEGDSVVELGPLSELSLTRLESRETVLSLASGALWAKVQELLRASGGQLRVETPTAVAAVRGTEFAVEHDAREGTRVGVFDEGRVEVSEPSGGAAAALGPNQELLGVAPGRAWRRPQALRHFQGGRRRIESLRRRAAFLKRSWKPLPPAKRREFRQQAFRRHAELKRRVQEKRRKIRRPASPPRRRDRRPPPRAPRRRP